MILKLEILPSPQPDQLSKVLPMLLGMAVPHLIRMLTPAPIVFGQGDVGDVPQPSFADAIQSLDLKEIMVEVAPVLVALARKMGIDVEIKASAPDATTTPVS